MGSKWGFPCMKSPVKIVSYSENDLINRIPSNVVLVGTCFFDRQPPKKGTLYVNGRNSTKRPYLNQPPSSTTATMTFISTLGVSGTHPFPWCDDSVSPFRADRIDHCLRRPALEWQRTDNNLPFSTLVCGSCCCRCRVVATNC